jgi:hypothetical protein
MHPDTQPTPFLNPVTGGMTQPRRWCLTERTHGQCGADGKLWEPKAVGFV